MEIRRFQREDTAAVRGLLGEGAPYVVPYSEYVYWILNRYCGRSCFVAEESGRILGFLAAVPSKERGCLFIWQIAVAAEARQKGIAFMLLERAWQEAQGAIEVSVDPQNRECMRLMQKAAACWGCRMEAVGEYSDAMFSETVYRIGREER